MDTYDTYADCRLCPRACGVDRRVSGAGGRLGFCGESHRLRVSYVGPHFGEEPPIVGENGSGTVFLTGCSLRCSFCQNHQISHQGLGRETTSEDLLKEIKAMIRKCRVHNINFVTPDHFFPHVLGIVSSLRRWFDIPMVFNLSGYQTL